MRADLSWLDVYRDDKKREKERKSTAFHEAGHLFWVWFTGGRVTSVNATAYQGVVIASHPGIDLFERKKWNHPDVLNYVRVMLAALCSQYRIVPGLWDIDKSGSHEDIINSMTHLVARGWKGSNGVHWSQYNLYDFFFEFSGGVGGPRDMVFDSNVWTCVTALADALMEHRKMDGKAAVEVILNHWTGELPELALPITEHGENSRNRRK